MFKPKILLPCLIGAVILYLFFSYNREKPTSLDGLLAQGNNYAKAGKLALAVNEYEKIVRVYPKSYEAHRDLAKLYIQVDETDKAKVELIRAIDIGKNHSKYDAYLILAQLYVSQGLPELGEDRLKEIKDLKSIKAKKTVGDFYYSWGNTLSKTDLLSAIRKLEIADKYYSEAQSKKLYEVQNTLINIYLQLANDLVSKGNTMEANRFLNRALAVKDEAAIHYKIAEINEKVNPDKAIFHYEKAFRMNSQIALPDRYTTLLLRKGNVLKGQKKFAEAKVYFKKAQKVSPQISIPYINDSPILVGIVSTRFSEDFENDLLLPGVTFTVRNINKQNINYLKTRVVFYNRSEKYSEVIKQIADNKKQIKTDEITSAISIYSSKPIDGFLAGYDVAIDIYLSKKSPDEWRLYRHLSIKK